MQPADLSPVLHGQHSLRSSRLDVRRDSVDGGQNSGVDTGSVFSRRRQTLMEPGSTAAGYVATTRCGAGGRTTTASWDLATSRLTLSRPRSKGVAGPSCTRVTTMP